MEKGTGQELRGNFWRVLLILFLCIDITMLICELVYFIRIYHELATLKEQINPSILPSLKEQEIRSSISTDFAVRISIILAITGISLFLLLKRKYKLAAIINGVPLLLGMGN